MKIICAGMNYATHNKEMHHTFINQEPVIFMKSDASLLKEGKPFFIPDFSSDMQYEGEIVIKISRLGKNIARRFACRYYEEVSVGIDMTARDLQKKFREKGLPWELSKSFDGSAVVGEFIRLDDLPCDVNHLPFHLDMNGRTVQEGNTAGMLFKTDELIEYVSRFVTLKTGDLIYTGTPAGVGQVHVGDHLQGYIGDKKVLDFHIR
ncbi:MAG: fumarylacetoacetate hydrolase family protein [Dysgonamonadaceae bacterium]|jgi:2-keto-4-pentenoate hydratase/2-oxohepta-3-ene-1,7-dioic acid hydratase in catechol pathway|nr:fumarylacetoacetate hydrolase family protein [Dysgonamonadaceae bacterium]